MCSKKTPNAILWTHYFLWAISKSAKKDSNEIDIFGDNEENSDEIDIFDEVEDEPAKIVVNKANIQSGKALKTSNDIFGDLAKSKKSMQEQEVQRCVCWGVFQYEWFVL